MLAFEDKVRTNRVAFVAKVRRIARNIGTNPDWLMGIMYHESRFITTADAYNPARGINTHTSGLIQFAGSTPATLGTTHAALKAMTNLQQLDYVEKFYLIWKRKGAKYDKPANLFLTTFYPAALINGWDKNKDYVFGSERSLAYAKRVARENQGFNLNKDSLLTMGEYQKYHKDLFRKYGINTIDNRLMYAGITVALFAVIAGYYYYLKNYAK